MTTYYIAPAPTGNNANSGTAIGSPKATFAHTLPLLVAGDILEVLEGTYTEVSTSFSSQLQAGSSGSRITVRSYSGNATKPKVRGGIYFYNPIYFTWSGIDVEWNSTLYPTGSESALIHMCKIAGGNNWRFEDFNLTGAIAHSALVIESWNGVDPGAGCVLTNFDIGNTIQPSYSSVNQDHALYITTYFAGQAQITRGRLWGTPNGRAIKLGPGAISDTSPTGNLLIQNVSAYNHRGEAPIQISLNVRDVLIKYSILVGAGTNKYAVENSTGGYAWTGTNVVVQDTIAYDALGVVNPVFTDGGGNSSRNPQYTNTATEPPDLHPLDVTSQAYGAYAPTGGTVVSLDADFDEGTLAEFSTYSDTGNAITVSTSQKYDGSAMRIQKVAAGQNAYVQYTISGTVTGLYGRMWFYPEAWPVSANVELIQINTAAGGTNNGRIQLTTTGMLRANIGGVSTNAVQLTLNTAYTIEWFYDSSTSTASMTIKVNQTSYGPYTAATAATTIGNIRWGANVSTVSTFTAFYDEIGLSTAGWLGALPVITPPPVVTVPTAPSGLGAVAAGPFAITLTWTDNSSNETSFVIERSANGTTGWAVVGSVTAGVVTYTDGSLAEGTTYYYRVKAANSAGSSAVSSTANATTTTLAPPYTMTITDGVSYVSLATSSGTGMRTIDALTLPPPVEVTTYASGYPFQDGARLTASALDNRAWDIPFLIVGTSVDNVDSQLHTLNRLLRQAVAWEKNRTGSPVRVAFKRQGATNVAYACVVGVPSMPTFVGGSIGLGAETSQNVLTGAMTLLLEPTWHPDAAVTVANATPITLTVNSSTVTTSALSGDMDGPVALTIAHTGASVWSEAWIAELTRPVAYDNIVQTADSAASNGSASAESNNRDLLVDGWVLRAYAAVGYFPTAADAFSHRFFARVKVTAGDTSKLQFRQHVVYGDSLATAVTTSPVMWPHGLNAYYLIDLGDVPRLAHLLNRYNMPINTTRVMSYLSWRTTDGGAATVWIDYCELLAYRSLVYLPDLSVAINETLVYESFSKSGTFVHPTTAPVVYGYTSANTLTRVVQRQGRLRPVTPGAVTRYWVQAQTTGGHFFTDSASVTVSHLPCYAQPLRGNA